MYIFALSILEGTDLINLFPSKLSLKQPGFYWFYQLRGNDVIYNAFHDLSKPFPMERASMNVRATKDSLLRFLTSELNDSDRSIITRSFFGYIFHLRTSIRFLSYILLRVFFLTRPIDIAES